MRTMKNGNGKSKSFLFKKKTTFFVYTILPLIKAYAINSRYYFFFSNLIQRACILCVHPNRQVRCLFHSLPHWVLSSLCHSRFVPLSSSWLFASALVVSTFPSIFRLVYSFYTKLVCSDCVCLDAYVVESSASVYVKQCCSFSQFLPF